MVCCNVVCGIVVLCDMVCDVVLSGVLWYGIVWYGMVILLNSLVMLWNDIEWYN